VSQPSATPETCQQRSNLTVSRVYLVTAAMVLGNLALPYAVHLIPDAGRVLLPIFFFTLVAGWAFGAQVGILTGILSPLANHYLTGMPPAAALRDIMLQSALLGALAAIVASRSRKLTLPLVALVVVLHQALALAPSLVHSGLQPALATLRLRAPGLLLQILGGFSVLWLMGRYLSPSKGPDVAR
jgi:hypothetical protein